MGDPDKEHAVTLRHPRTKGDRHGQGPTKKQSGGQETQKEEDQSHSRSTKPKGCKRSYVRQALAELDELLERRGLSLPIGLSAPLAQAAEAFEHVRRGRPGRAIILPN